MFRCCPCRWLSGWKLRQADGVVEVAQGQERSLLGCLKAVWRVKVNADFGAQEENVCRMASGASGGRSVGVVGVVYIGLKVQYPPVHASATA